jgi:predicted permease
MASIKSGTASARDGRQRLRGVLVSVQIAVAVALLLGTGLFARALSRALSIDLGFDAEKVVVVGASADHVQLGTAEAMAMRAAAVERVAQIPGVTGVTWTGTVPLTSAFDRQTAVVDGYTPAQGERVAFEYSGVGARYHEVMGIPIVQGRGFDDRDLSSGEPVAIINETAVRRYFAGRDPIGATIRMGGMTGRVVGVARDIMYHRLNEDPRPYLYFPLSDVRQDLIFVRAEHNTAALLRDVEQAVRAASPGVPVVTFGTLQDRLHTVLAPQLGGAWLLGGFGALALLIAVVGIYGVVAYTVEQRTREIGIRIAIGADSFDLLRGVIVRSVALVAIGVGAGLALGLGLGRASRGFLFGVPPHDPATMAATAVIALLVGVVAAAVPARRAVRIDPSAAIRTDG